jgi:chromosome segregation ATPase
MVQTDHTNPEMPRGPAGELGQEHELLVKLETAEDEVARAAQLIARLEGEQFAERRAIMRQRQTIAALRRELLRRETSLAARNGRADGRRLDLELLCTQLQLTNKELKTIHEQLEQSNRALHKANAELESRVAERTAQLEKLVGQLSVAVSERDALLEAQRMLAR